MIGTDHVVLLVGALTAIVAIASLRDRSNPRRFRNAAFWGAYATNLLLGPHLPDVVNGLLVVVLVVTAAGGLGRGAPETTTDEERLEGAARHGNRLFVPALLVPALTLVGSLLLREVRVGGALLIEPKSVSLVALGFAAVVALASALVLLRQPATAPVREHRRLMDLVGWAAVLPQMLAAIGVVFAAAGVGDRIAELLARVVPLDARVLVVCAYTGGMALFTVIMGNAFAAFPIMTAAVGLPLLVVRFGGDPAIVGALGMLSGFCGTLLTPMAANFNVVPAALLELPNERPILRVQAPTALVLLVANTLLACLFVGRR